MKNTYYWLGLAAIGLLATFLRFWHLGELNFLVFDEVYFPKYAYDFLTDQYYFDVHPPLSKYLIGIGIVIYNHLPWVNDPAIGSVSIDQLSAVSWRWLNAVTGIAVCFVGAALAHVLTKNRWFVLIVALFLAIDGSLIVESRFGMNNIYIVFFGLSGMLCLALALRARTKHRRFLIACGVFLGLTYSVKWNGLGYSLAAWAIVFAGGMALIVARFNLLKIKGLMKELSSSKVSLFREIPLWEFPAYLIAIPLVVYVLMWQPHLNQYSNYGFVGMQKQIMGYHSNSVTSDEHPYCSKWYTWPLMARPIGYHFKIDTIEKHGQEIKNYQDVHLFGNPFLYWMSIIAVFYLSVQWLLSLLAWFKSGKLKPHFEVQSFLVVGFFANWLPWMLVSRCLFLYHYLPSAVFSFMSLAWLVAQLILKGERWSKALAGTIIIVVLLAFIYWLPLQLGIVLPSAMFYERMWFSSWI